MCTTVDSSAQAAPSVLDGILAWLSNISTNSNSLENSLDSESTWNYERRLTQPHSIHVSTANAQHAAQHTRLKHERLPLLLPLLLPLPLLRRPYDTGTFQPLHFPKPIKSQDSQRQYRDPQDRTQRNRHVLRGLALGLYAAGIRRANGDGSG